MRLARFAPLVLFGGALAQTTAPPPAAPPVTRLSAYYLLPGATAYVWASIVLDAPLALALDATGQAHLGFAQPYTITITPARIVRNEIPAPSDRGWTLQHPPLFGATCWRNGVHQSPGVDYTLAGTLLTSATWTAGDVLACDYEW